MSDEITMSDEIKWRGSTYEKEKIIEDGRVFWYNPISRHHDSCSVESWKAGIPYDPR